MNETGSLRKMAVAHNTPVEYALRLDDREVPINTALGKRISIHYDGEIHCINCGRKTKKSYSQGHCFPCSQRLASCDMCIVRPNTCHYHEGTCREPDWGEANCMQPHVVYLANSSGLKVGITRRSQIPTRWIDQGAAAALPIVAASTRRIAGLLEVALARHVSDKTDWRRMLRGQPEPVDLATRRHELLEQCATDLSAVRQQFGQDAFATLEDEAALDIVYPVENYPAKVRSVTLDKLPTIEGALHGIKGQYLILDNAVMNIRRHAGYKIRWQTED